MRGMWRVEPELKGLWVTGIPVIVGAVLLMFSGRVTAAEPSLETPTKVGIYLQSISSVDVTGENFVIDFYVWTLSPKDGPDPLASLALPQSVRRTVVDS